MLFKEIENSFPPLTHKSEGENVIIFHLHFG